MQATPLFDKLVFSKVKERLGGRVKLIVSGGAPLAGGLLPLLCTRNPQRKESLCTHQKTRRQTHHPTCCLPSTRADGHFSVFLSVHSSGNSRPGAKVVITYIRRLQRSKAAYAWLCASPHDPGSGALGLVSRGTCEAESLLRFTELCHVLQTLY